MQSSFLVLIRHNCVGEKQYSILELLELQARARAIRSQLALEPVTKIELDDSDDETVDISKKPESTKPVEEVSTNEKNKTQGDVTEHFANKKSNEPTKSISESTEEPRVPSSRPIRLKRNFRTRQIDEEDVSAPAPAEAEKTAEKNVDKSTEKGVEKNMEKSTEQSVEKEVEKSPAKSPEKNEETAEETRPASVIF